MQKGPTAPIVVWSVANEDKNRGEKKAMLKGPNAPIVV
jgi:hypothetical protein